MFRVISNAGVSGNWSIAIKTMSMMMQMTIPTSKKGWVTTVWSCCLSHRQQPQQFQVRRDLARQHGAWGLTSGAMEQRRILSHRFVWLFSSIYSIVAFIIGLIPSLVVCCCCSWLFLPSSTWLSDPAPLLATCVIRANVFTSVSTDEEDCLCIISTPRLASQSKWKFPLMNF